MFNFDYYNPTRILFGQNRLNSLNDLVPANAKVLIIYGGGSAVKSGLIDKIKVNLGQRKVLEFGGVEPNPRFETLMKAVEVVRSENVDFLLAVGGGSVLDGTKFISLSSPYKGNVESKLRTGLGEISVEVAGEEIPFGTVLTLPATGSEMNCGAVVSYEHNKFYFVSELLYPKFSILDPTVTFTLPARQIGNGIVDSFVHVIEQYITFPVDAKVQDRMAEGILLTLIEIGRTNLNDTENYDARANLVWSATMALNGIIAAGVPQDWASHLIGHELTSMFGLDHGQTLAIVLPSLLEVRRKNKHVKLVQYAERVWQITSGTEDEKIELAILKTREFFENVGVKTHLSDYNIGAEQIPLLIDNLKKHGLTALSESGDLTPDIAQEIFEKSL